MDWGFLNYFKKENFNIIVFSLAVAGWIIKWVFPSYENEYLLLATLVASIYCVAKLIVYSYQYFSGLIHKKQFAAQKEKETKDREDLKEQACNIEISRMFEGLSEENKNLLVKLINKGKKDSINYNVLHYPKYGEVQYIIKQAKHITDIIISRETYDEYVLHSIIIQEYHDSVAVIIYPHLYDLIKKYIEKNHIKTEDI